MALSDDELLAAVDAAENSALGVVQGDVTTDRADAIDRYLGRPYGNEVSGRSSVVSRDVADVVEGVVANVLKPFVSGDEVVQFNPRGPDDQEQSQQETDYVNYVALERNPGFLVLTTAIKDALLLRNGYVKVQWHVRSDVTLETYQGLTDDELAMVQADKEVEVVSDQAYPDPTFVMPPMPAPDVMQGMMPQVPMLHDIKVRRALAVEYARIDPAPPDEILVSARATGPSLQDCDFVQHRTFLTLSELRQMGYDVDDDIVDDDQGANIEQYARSRFSGEYANDAYSDPTGLPERRMVLFKESWIRIDRDGDGIAELRRVCHVGHTLLDDEEADLIPIACFAAIIMPHQHIQISVYDLVKDIAEQKTTLWRQYLDNLYRSNNVEYIIDVDRANLDDFLISRPGGLKRVQGNPADVAVPMIPPQLGAAALNGLQYLDMVRENRTGFTKAAEGLKPDSLSTGTLGEFQAQVSQSTMRLEMIARTIAETGVKDLFRIVHAMTLKHSTRAEKVKLRNQWVDINPREWVKRTELSISVGLGTSSTQTQLQNLMLIAQAQEKAMPMGLVTPDNVYATAKKLAIAAGYKNPTEFFTEPPKQPKMGPDGRPVMGPDGKPVMESVPPPPQKDPIVQAEEIKQQGQMQQKQIDAQIESAKIDKQFQRDITLQQSNDQRQAALDQNKLALEKEKMDREYALEQWKAEQEMKLEMWKKQLELETQERIAAMTAVGSVEEARVSSQAQGAPGSPAPKAAAPRRSGSDAALVGVVSHIAKLADGIKQIAEHVSSPPQLERGPDGKVARVRKGNKVMEVKRGPDGKPIGLQ